MMEQWINLGDASELGERRCIVKHGRERIVVTRIDGKFYAFDALCPHAQGPMERIEVQGAIVSCPLHAWRFDLEKGGQELHGYRGLRVFPVKVENGSVFVAAGS